MKRKLSANLTSVTLPIFVANTSSTLGGGLSGLVFNTSGLVAEYRRQSVSTWTTIALVSGTLGTWASGGFVADGALAGAYELQIPDAICASGARWVAIRLYGAANMLPCLIEIEIDAVNYQDAVKFGLSAVPSNTVQVNGVAVSTADGTAQAGAATSITLATADPAGANAYVDRILTLVGGTGAGQSRYITAYNSTTKVATVQRAWDTAPDATTQYAINDTAATSAVTGGDTAGTTTLLSRLPAALSFTGANVNANAQAVVDKAGYTVSTVQDKAGYSGTATNFVAAPTPAQNAAAITFPATVALVPADETKIASLGADTPGTTALRGLVNAGGTAFTAPALALAPTGGGGTPQTGDLFGLLSPLVSAGRLTAGALSLAPLTQLPADFLSTAEQAKLANLDAPVSGVPALSASALLLRPVPGAGMTTGQLLALLGLGTVRPNVTNTWHADTHVLDTDYRQSAGGLALLTTHAQYPAAQVLNPSLLSVTGAASAAAPQP